jgi:GDP-L-fucose synthase
MPQRQRRNISTLQGTVMTKVVVLGHSGMVGQALCRALSSQRDTALFTPTRHELDLTQQAAVHAYIRRIQPDHVYVAAAKVGGIWANMQFPADFIAQNLLINAHVIQACHAANVDRTLLFGSSCIYPKFAPQPITEAALLTSALEPSNEPYAIAKIAALKMAESYYRQYGMDIRALMPTNLYGPGDNFHAEHSHVIPALLKRFHEAKLQGLAEVVIWGSGQAQREFLHVDDLAAAALHVMQLPTSTYNSLTQSNCRHLNVGSSEELSIAELAKQIAMVTGFQGAIVFDHSKPDGTPRKLVDSELIRRSGWQARYDLQRGLSQTYAWYVQQSHFRMVAAG